MEGEKNGHIVIIEVLSPSGVSRFPCGSCCFNVTHFRHSPVLDALPPPPLPRSPLSLFGLCEPLSAGLERPSLPILDNCESPLIGLRRKRITWARNDVMARGPCKPSLPTFSSPNLLTPPPPYLSTTTNTTTPIKTKSSSAPNVLETNRPDFLQRVMHACAGPDLCLCSRITVAAVGWHLLGNTAGPVRLRGEEEEAKITWPLWCRLCAAEYTLKVFIWAGACPAAAVAQTQAARDKIKLTISRKCETNYFFSP